MTSIEFRFEYMLFLLIINKIEEFRSSYKLNRFLSFYYEMHPADAFRLPEKLKAIGLVEEERKGTLMHYSTTSAGREYLEFWKHKFLPILFEQYPEKLEISEGLARQTYGEFEK